MSGCELNTDKMTSNVSMMDEIMNLLFYDEAWQDRGITTI